MLKRCRWIGALLAGTLAHAGVLEWTPSAQTVVAECGQTEVVAVFGFRNPGDKPVRILSTRSGCDCLESGATPQVCEPGARGELRAVFSLGEREGVQRREILVQTDAAASPESVVLTVQIPTWVGFSSRLVWWERDEPASAKPVVVRLAAPKDIEILSVEGTDPMWEIRRGEPGADGSFELLIRPLGTQKASRAEFVVKARIGGLTRTYRLFAFVK